MPSPKSQVTLLFEGLQKAPELALPNLRLLLSAKKMARTGAPPRIVIFPTTGDIVNPMDRSTANRDVDRIFVAHIWGADFDETCDLEKRFLQSLVYQAAGGDPLSATTAAPGIYFTATGETWEVSEDSNRQGEEVFVLFSGRAGLSTAAFDALPKGRGQVNSISYNQLSTALAQSMLIGDIIAVVNSTAGFPTSGLLTIDGEQMQYTGTTPSSFVGLIRGVNNTTATTHNVSAAVNVT